MPTPFDNKLLLVQVKMKFHKGKSVEDIVRTIKARVPNAAGVLLQVNQGKHWQAKFDSHGQAIQGPAQIEMWTAALGAQGLECHVWGIPHGLDVQTEAQVFIDAARAAGVRSLGLDVEHGQYYFRGSATDGQRLMRTIRDALGPAFHISLILDGRKNRPWNVFVDPWLPFVDSLVPMVYPWDFKQTVATALDTAFKNLTPLGKPIAPMLQSYNRIPPADITDLGVRALAHGAVGISYFCLGDDHMGEAEAQAIAAVTMPSAAASMPADAPAGPRPAAPLMPLEPSAAPVPMPAAAMPAAAPSPAALTPSPVTTTTVNTPMPPAGPSNQDVINAFAVVAKKYGEHFDGWVTAAGIRSVYDSRKTPYIGPPIPSLPNIGADRLAAIAEMLKLDSRSLVQAAGGSAPASGVSAKGKVDGRIWGVHGAAGTGVPPIRLWDWWIDELKAMGIKWYKQCDSGGDETHDGSVFKWVLALRNAGITPIVRYLKSQQFPSGLDDGHYRKMELYKSEGVLWAEIGNEPNLAWEWSPEYQSRLAFHNPEIIQILMEMWVRDAEEALSIGVRPAFYAMAVTDWRHNFHPNWSSVKFYEKFFEYLGSRHLDRVRDFFRAGAWLAVHVATYSEPLDLDPFGQGGAVWDMCLRGYEPPMRLIDQHLGLKPGDYPVMSTEGGVFTPDSTSMHNHPRLANDEAQSEEMVRMFDWLEENSPLQAICPWCISVSEAIGHKPEEYVRDGWYLEGDPPVARAVVAKLKGVHRRRSGR